MTQTVNVPGVGQLQFPDGMSQDDMASAIKKNFPQIHEKQRLSPADLAAKIKADVAAMNDPKAREARYQKLQLENSADMPWYKQELAGAGKAVADTGRGLGELVGLVSPNDVAESRRRDQGLMSTTGGRVGNALGYIAEAAPAAIAAPTAGLGAGASLAARAGLGAALGAARGFTSPYVDPGERTPNALIGGTIGAVIPVGAQGVSGALKMSLAKLATPEARALMAEGVKLTPGQMLGGAAKSIEDHATSIPFLGDAIKKAQGRTLEDFNKAALNRVLAPLGQKLGKADQPGYQAIDNAGKMISKTYNSTLSQMSGKIDPKFAQNIGSLWQKYKALPDKEASELEAYIQKNVLEKFDAQGSASGQVLKKVESDLGNNAKKLMLSDDRYRQDLGMAVKELQGHVKDMFRSNNSPALVAKLDAADQAFRQMKTVEKAAGYVGAKEGIFTPAQLRGAARSSDATRYKSAFSTGKATMQDLGDAGKKVLPSSVPDSGTAGRLMHSNVIGLTTGAVTSPLAALYSRPGISVANALMSGRPSPTMNYLAHLAQSRLGNPTNALMTPIFQQQSPQTSPAPLAQ